MPRFADGYLPPCGGAAKAPNRGNCGEYERSPLAESVDTPERSGTRPGQDRREVGASSDTSLHKATEPSLKTVTGQALQRGNPVQVVGRRLDGNVTHIEGQLRQAALNIAPVPIPSDERLDSKTVPEIMHARSPALFILDAGSVKEPIDRKLKPEMTVRMRMTAIAIAQKRRAWISCERSSSLPQVGL